MRYRNIKLYLGSEDMFQNIILEDLFEKQKKEDITLIDVRSPKEFAEFSIPGSINIPVFDNDERAEVGTLYKQVSPEKASERGLEIFSAKLPAFIAAFKSISNTKVVYCWRGGMRSKTAATVLSLMNIPSFRLDGGIKSYRKWVMKTIEESQFSPKLYVLNGYTGTGKTILLKRLEAKGYPVIDLEGLANHRGSIFGQIGLEPHNQKTFESLLVEDMIRLQDARFVLVEGESKRVGMVMIPDSVYDKKEQGIQLFLDLPLDVRVQNILKEYHPFEHKEELIDAFQIIQRHIDPSIAKEINHHLRESKFEAAIKLLLTYYYDPKYEYSIKHHSHGEQNMIIASNLDEAFEMLIDFIEKDNR